MGQSAWEQAAEANCGLGLCENVACMEKRSLLQRDQSVVQGWEYPEQGRGFGSGGDELHSMQCPAEEPRGSTAPPATLQGGSGQSLHSPPVGFRRFCAREEFGGVSSPGEKLCALSWALLHPALAADTQRDDHATLLAAVGCCVLIYCALPGSSDLCTPFSKPHSKQQHQELWWWLSSGPAWAGRCRHLPVPSASARAVSFS